MPHWCITLCYKSFVLKKQNFCCLTYVFCHNIWIIWLFLVLFQPSFTFFGWLPSSNTSSYLLWVFSLPSLLWCQLRSLLKNKRVCDEQTNKNITIYCRFSGQLWDTIFARLSPRQPPLISWAELLSWCRVQTPSAPATLRKLVTHTLIYHVWRQRNKFLHNSTHLSQADTFRLLDRDVRNVITARRNKRLFTNLTNDLATTSFLVFYLIFVKKDVCKSFFPCKRRNVHFS